VSVLQAPTGLIFWRLPDLEPNRKNLCELLDTKRTNSRREALEETMGIFSISRFHLQQNTLVSFV
jgi:hypothetical protein